LNKVHNSKVMNSRKQLTKFVQNLKQLLVVLSALFNFKKINTKMLNLRRKLITKQPSDATEITNNNKIC